MEDTTITLPTISGYGSDSPHPRPFITDGKDVESPDARTRHLEWCVTSLGDVRGTYARVAATSTNETGPLIGAKRRRNDEYGRQFRILRNVLWTKPIG